MNKNYAKCEQNHANITCSHNTLDLDNSSKKKFEKFFLISNSTLDELSMTPLTFLCDEYIDRSKLTEQKKETHLSI